MTETLRAGVIGAGVFGGYHANKYQEVTGAELVGIYDADGERAAAAASERGAAPYTDLDAFLADVDVVTVASPATTHGSVAQACLKAGNHVLVEKPIALDLGEADALISLANEKGLVLQVGHQERYVAGAFGLLSRGAPRHVRSRRMNKFSGRATDVSVVFDLMVHDLDLLAQFADVDAAEITSIKASQSQTDKPDNVHVTLSLPGGVTAELIATRTEETPVRDLLVEYADGEVGLDFLGRYVRNTTETPLAATFEGDDRPPALIDPLRYGTQAFVDAVRGQTEPLVTGVHGRRALALALKIEHAAIAAIA